MESGSMCTRRAAVVHNRHILGPMEIYPGWYLRADSLVGGCRPPASFPRMYMSSYIPPVLLAYWFAILCMASPLAGGSSGGGKVSPCFPWIIRYCVRVGVCATRCSVGYGGDWTAA